MLAEPTGHVNQKKFQSELEAAQAAGFEVADRPTIRRSMAAVLRRKDQS